MRSRWVTFDCFGTLVDWHAGFAAILRPVAGEQTEALIRAYHGLERRIQAERPFRLYREVLQSSLLLAARELGIALTEKQAASLPNRWGSLPVFADVELMFAALRATGYKIAVLTNCDEDLFAETQRSFRQPFDLVLTAERVREYKPAHAHFHSFEKITGVSRPDWVHVGSSWFHDIAPARELGLQHVWLDRERSGGESETSPLRVLSAADLPGTVNRLLEPTG